MHVFSHVDEPSSWATLHGESSGLRIRQTWDQAATLPLYLVKFFNLLVPGFCLSVQ